LGDLSQAGSNANPRAAMKVFDTSITRRGGTIGLLEFIAREQGLATRFRDTTI
jgi:hypothetical protein